LKKNILNIYIKYIKKKGIYKKNKKIKINSR